VAAVAPQQAPAAMPWLESTGVAPLIPDVVDEPELIELHQSDPALAEELVLQVEDADLLRGLLRVVLT
jgi:hypothetical protein